MRATPLARRILATSPFRGACESRFELKMAGW